MPDLNGVLTQPERDKVYAWFNKNWANPPKCPMCDSHKFILSDHVVMPTVYANTNVVYVGENVISPQISSMSYPQIMLMCEKCGLVLYFNAVTIGIWESQNAE
jgi:hypothetical protein